MSIRGTFYAVTDSQLARVLEGSLDGDDFLAGRSPEAPAERFSGGEAVWYELTKLLDPEDGCGVEGTEAIPEGGAYSFSADVQRISGLLNALEREELARRYARLDTDFSFDEIYAAILGLVPFYQRSAAAKHAMLFNLR